MMQTWTSRLGSGGVGQATAAVRWKRCALGTASVAAILVLAAAVPAARSGTTSAAVACVGDCTGDGEVSIDDLLTMVNIAVNGLPVGDCVAGDVNADGEITIDEILLAVSAALTGCTPAPTPTATVTGPGPTTTPRIAAGSVASGSIVIANAMSAVRGVVAAFVTGIQVGGSGDMMCRLGGAASSSSDPPFSIEITLSQCKLPTSTGSVTFNGTASTNRDAFNAAIEATYEDANGSPTLVANTVINGTLGTTPGPVCFLTAVVLDITNGRIGSRIPGGNEVAVTFQTANVVFGDITYNESCVPVIYQMTFNGDATLQAPGSEPADVTLTDLRLGVNDRADPTLSVLVGELDSPCFGGKVTVETESALRVGSGQVCPADGRLIVTSAAEEARVFYRPDQSVDVDSNGNGVIEPDELHVANCFDPRLAMCRQ